MNMTVYYDQLQETLLNCFKRVNTTDVVEKHQWSVPAGTWDISVVRGEVLEKATASRVRLSTKNPLNGIDTRFDIFQVNIFPASPMVPLCLCNMEHRTGTEETFNGYLDTASLSPRTDEQQILQQKIKQVMQKHGADYETYRNKVAEIYMMPGWEKPLNDGIGVRLEFEEKQSDLFKEIASTWFKEYFALLERRQNDAVDTALSAARNTAHIRLLEYYVVKDVSVQVAGKLGIPFDAVGLMAFPPSIRF